LGYSHCFFDRRHRGSSSAWMQERFQIGPFIIPPFEYLMNYCLQSVSHLLYHLILMNELYFKDEETESQSGELVLWPITHVIELSLLTAYALISIMPYYQCLLIQFSSVAQSCPTLCNPMNCSTPGLPVHHQLPEFTQTHIHRVSDATQPSHPMPSPSLPAPNPSQHQSFPMSQLFA